MKKLFSLIVLAAVIAAAVIGYQRVTAKKLRQDVEARFPRTSDGLLDDLRAIYRQGGEGDKARCARMLISMTLEQKSGAWRAQGVEATLTADAGAPNRVTFEPLAGLVLKAEQTAWGEESPVGIMESPSWIRFSLANFTDRPVTVERGDLLAHDDRMRVFASSNLGQEEPGVVPTLAPGRAITSACRFPILDRRPRYLEFNNGSIVARTAAPGATPVTAFDRNAHFWPEEKAKAAFPARVKFSEQILDETQSARFRPGTPKPVATATAKPAKQPARAAAPAR